MRVLLVADTVLERTGCTHLGATLRRQGVEVLEDPPLDLEALATSDLLLQLDAIGLFVEPDRVPPFLQRLHQAAALRGIPPVAVISGPSAPLAGDALVADLLPRLDVDLLCLQGRRQSEDLADLLHTSGHRAPASVELGLWGVGPQQTEIGESGGDQPPGDLSPRPRHLVFLEQAHLPPAPGARERLLEMLERLADASPNWDVTVQADPFRADPPGRPPHGARDATEGPQDPSLADLLLQRPRPGSLRFSPPEAWRQSVERAGVCATISSPLLWQALAHACPLLLLGDYGIRTDMDGPLLFGSGLMQRLSSCEHLDALLDLPRPNPAWLHELGWGIQPDAKPLVRWLAGRSRGQAGRDAHGDGR